MNPAQTGVIPPNTSDFSLALLYAQDSDVVVPLRQYLEEFGCMICVNELPAFAPTYLFVIGTPQYVQSITEQLPFDGKLLVLVYDGEGPQGSMHLPPHAKLAHIDPRPMTRTELVALFSFYFSDKSTRADFRTEQPKKVYTKEVVHEATHMPERVLPRKPTLVKPDVPWDFPRSSYLPGALLPTADETRVGDLMAQVFQVSAPTKRRHQHGVKVAWGIGILCTSIFLFYVWWATALGMSMVILASSVQNLRSTQESTATPLVGFSFWFGQARQLTPLALLPFGVGKDALVTRYDALFSFMEASARLTRSVYHAQQVGVRAARVFSPSGDVVAHEPLSVVLGSLRVELSELQMMTGVVSSDFETLVQQPPFPVSLVLTKSRVDYVRQKLYTARRLVGASDQLLTLYQGISGFDGKKTYLVLLQNSMELRPTGGFIGSVGVVTVMDGRIADIQIRDVYDLDGQLKGHVAPPAPIAELLGQEHWYLRDSNWDPDFEHAATQALWFYDKEGGGPVDGVIGISVPLLVDILRAVGPVDLPDLHDRITADNFFGKSLFYTHADFFPGSTQKKDFLSGLFSKLMTEVTHLDGRRVPALVEAVMLSLDRHDIQFYFHDPVEQHIVTSLGWAGHVNTDTQCAHMLQPCFFDRTYIVESNMGVNKANYFVKRSESQDIQFMDDGTVEETISLQYANASREGTSDGGGPYTNYLRALLPVGSVIRGVTLDGTPIPERRNQDRGRRVYGSYIERDTTDPNHVIVGIVFAVPPQEQRRLVIQYARSEPFVFTKGNASYMRVIQKQPGQTQNGFQMQIRYPKFWRATDVATGSFVAGDVRGTMSSVAKASVVEYNMDLSRDRTIRLQFTR